jgi:hypothetical protein
MKLDVTDVDAGSQWHTERLNGAVNVFVIERVLVMPDSSRRVGHFVTHEPDAVISRVGLNPVHRCASPSPDRRLHPHCGAVRGKAKIGGTAHIVLTVGSVVKHVALRRMRLTPGIFVRGDVLGLGKVGRSLI